MKKTLFLFLFILMSVLGMGQNSFKKDPKLSAWFMYFGNAKIENTKWNFNYDVQYRNHEVLTDLNQLLIRGTIQYHLFENLTLGTGYAFITTEQFEKPDLPVIENRIFQDAILQQKVEKTSIRHRFRFEQRFVENQDFKTRLRYQLAIDTPLYQNHDKNTSLYASFYNEVFINSDKTTRKINPFDRDRLYLGVGYKFNKNTAFQFGWMNQMMQKKSYQQLMFSLHHNVKL